MTTLVTTSDSFASRVKDAMRGEFRPFMNRSFLFLALFEAKRCIAPRISKMRPFQQRIALLTTAMDLIYTLDFLTEEQKAAVVSMTAKNDSKPCIAKIMAGNREKQIKERILPEIEELLSEEKIHKEVCDEFVQKQYEKTGRTGPRPLRWEFRSIPAFLIYRVYYRKLDVDQEVFAPVAPREVDVPSKRPDNALWEYAIGNWSPMTAGTSADGSNPDVDVGARGSETGEDILKANLNNVYGGKEGVKMNLKKRLETLMEIKVRLELLKEIEEHLPKGRVAKDMRLLFSALPPPLAAGEFNNRQAVILEAQLRMDLLKQMKTVIPSKRIVREMKTLLNRLPLLPRNGDLNGKGLGVKKNAAGLGVNANANDKTKSESDKIDSWENVDDMKVVSSAVDGMETNPDVDVGARGNETSEEIPKANLNKVYGSKDVKMNPKKRLERLMEIKVRLELLKEIEEHLPKRRVMKEMKLLFSALPGPLTAEEMKNRPKGIFAAQLQMSLLKQMTNVIPSKRIVKEMKILFNKVPPLHRTGDLDGKALVVKMNAAGLSASANANDKTALESDKIDGLDNVDDMKGVSSAVDGMEITLESDEIDDWENVDGMQVVSSAADGVV